MAVNLQTPTSRAKLAPQGKPYKVRLLPGVFLGYRAARSGIGAWVVIASDGKGGQWTKAFGHADDKQKADGDAVLNYEQAAGKARALARGDANAAADRPVTIVEALAAYEDDLKGRGRRAYNAEWPRKHLPAHLREQALSTVTSKQLRQWRDALTKTDLTAASVNKIAKSARAAFVLAGKLDPRVAANVQAWTVGLEMLPNSVKSRDAVLPDAQVTAVVAAAYAIDERFGLFVQAHAETGSRSSQLARCLVADLLAGENKLMVPASRKGRNGGHGGHVGVPLTAGLAARLRQAAAGRAAGEPLFLQSDGQPWREGDHKRPFAKAATIAGIEDATIYALRHSSIARLLLRGLPIRIVAELHNTSTPIIEQHYGRFVVKHGDDLVRAALIDTSPAPVADNVVRLGKR
jgi:integrase